MTGVRGCVEVGISYVDKFDGRIYKYKIDQFSNSLALG